MTNAPFGGGDSIDQAFRTASGALQVGVNAASGNELTANTEPGAFGLPAILDYQPQTWQGRIAGRISEELGAAVPIVGTAVGVGQRMSRTAIDAMPSFAWRNPATYAPGAAKSLLAAGRANPTALAAQEAIISSGAGLGAGVANEVFDNEDRENMWIDLLGAVGGAGLMGIASAVLPRLRDIGAAAGANPKYTSGYVNEAVAAELAANSSRAARQLAPNDLARPVDTDPLVEALTSNPAIADAIPGFQPTTAEVLRDPGLRGLQESRARAQNPSAELFRIREDDNAQAVEGALREVAPSRPASVLREELQVEANRRVGEAEAAAAAAARDADRAVAPLTPATTRVERGDAIRENISAAEEAAAAQRRAAYEASGASAVPVDPTEVRAVIDEAARGLTQVRQGLLPQDTLERVRRLADGGAGPEPTGILDALGQPIMRAAAPAEPVRMAEVLDLYSELGRLERAALADPRANQGGANAAEAIGRVRTALRGYIDRTLPEDVRNQRDLANALRFEEAERFQRQGDPIARATATYNGGFPQMSNERVASTFTQPENIDLLMARVPNDETRRAVREEILSRGDFRTSEGAAAFRERYGDQLRRFPGLADEIARVEAARSQAEGARQQADTISRDLGPSGQSNVARYLRFGDERADDAMRSVLNNPRPAEAADDLLSFVRDDPRAVQGARQAFWNVMERESRSANLDRATRSGMMPWDGGKWARFMADPTRQAVAERLYRDNPEHWEQVQDIAANLAAIAQFSRETRSANPSGTAFRAAGANVTLAEVQAKYYEVMRGRANMMYMMTYLGTRIANRAVANRSQAAFSQLLDRALLDPEVAAMLLREYNPANRAALRRSASSWIGANGAAALDAAFDDDDEGGLPPVDLPSLFNQESLRRFGATDQDIESLLGGQ